MIASGGLARFVGAQFPNAGATQVARYLVAQGIAQFK
jgi:hypothetical protein